MPHLTPLPQAQTQVAAIDSRHGQLGKQSQDLYHLRFNRELVSFEPMHFFALLPHLQPPAGRVLDWLYVGVRNDWPFLYWCDSQAAAHAQVEQLFSEPGWIHNQDT